MRRRPRRVLRDRGADRLLREQGYAVVPFIPAEVAARLRAEHAAMNPDAGVGFVADLNDPDPARRRRVASLGAEALEPVVERTFDGYRGFLWSYLCKWPGDPEDLYLHRDWMFVDERVGRRSFNIWIALQDIGGENGVLRVLPYSHRLPNLLTGTNLSDPWVEHRGAMVDRLVSVPVRAGEAVITDHALIHGSFANRSAEPRVALGVAVRGTGVPLLHFRRAGRTATRFDVDEEFFVTYTPDQLMAEPPRLPVAEELAVPEAPWVDPEVLLGQIDALAAPVSRRRRRGGQRPVRSPG